eukprot:CAMPEP_0202393960 /NCGR_PEP_ID=MMETSP1127-20130417/93179_1 /ASSEMBLY_ACC=CAM_ASM_000462 /TAXON_ID=3047 /ORGANISM="Dunaliella tertiolecta, Strain CCMP1320" /LENGTH=636 /DNA_ID=CAMNT_0048996559 /DNA_START=2099 /DNA_END=4007 /DNA_ORIENTATION=+
MDEGDELEQAPLQRIKSNSVLATERLLAAKGLNAEQSVGRILSPHHHYYKKWCLVVAGMALLLAIIDPLHLAFATPDGLFPYDDFWAVMVYIMMIVFGTDMALKFFVAYDDPERGMVYEPKLIALNYFRFWFWVDLATTLPLESIAVAGVGGNQGYNDRQCLFLGLIRWINLVRLYRIFGAFEYLNRKMMIGQVALTLLRTTTVMLLAIIDPLHLAFATPDGLFPYDDFWAVMVYIMMIVFGTDMALKFFVAYDDPERGMVYEPKLIALNYFRFWFWVDLATTLPLESIAVAGVGGNQGYNDRQCLFLGLIRWINLVRLYRIFGAFEYLNRKMMIGQVALTLLRTTTVLFYVAHWMACIFYFIARAEGFTSNSWAGSVETMVDAEPWGRYFLSLYFSFVILTGFGDNTFYDKNAVESCFVIGYLLISVLLNAFILGSITTVMVADDEISHVFRERVESLNAFSKQKELPESLSELMREYLELLHHTESTSDELILHRYPPTLRKKVLRHLYLDIFRKCPPFKGCRTRFLDEVIGMARMEIFNPEMEVLVEGEVVQELFVIVEGVVYGAKSASSASQERKAAKLRSKSSKSARFGSMAMSGSMNPNQSFTSQREDSAQSANGSVSMKGGLSMKGGQG